MGDMKTSSLRIVKIGGSLLDYEDLPKAWENWLARQPELPTVIVVGGGSLVDQVRSWNERYPLEEETAHWMCVRAMAITASLLYQRLPGTSLVQEWVDLKQQLAEESPFAPRIFSVESFLRSVEPGLAGAPLPCSWDVTSDSIAARIAEVLAARELVLCKSISQDVDISWHEQARAGHVDAHFPLIVEEIASIRWLNLRSASVIS
jgi:aspartokinase-like uncharacterized kinase